jgi:hypothetical protein
MIKVIENSNFPQFLQLIWGDVIVEEFQNTRKALREARKMARAQGQDFIFFVDQYKEVA